MTFACRVNTYLLLLWVGVHPAARIAQLHELEGDGCEVPLGFLFLCTYRSAIDSDRRILGKLDSAKFCAEIGPCLAPASASGIAKTCARRHRPRGRVEE